MLFFLRGGSSVYNGIFLTTGEINSPYFQDDVVAQHFKMYDKQEKKMTT